MTGRAFRPIVSVMIFRQLLLQWNPNLKKKKNLCSFDPFKIQPPRRPICSEMRLMNWRTVTSSNQKNSPSRYSDKVRHMISTTTSADTSAAAQADFM
jgi:hypothetical protein